MANHPAYLPVLLWSLLILASFWGWGEALRRLIKRKEFEDLGWGLTAAWGMAVTLALGGLLMAFSLAKAPVLTLLVLTGALFTTAFWFQSIGFKPVSRKRESRAKSKRARAEVSVSENLPQLVCVALLAGLAAFGFAGSITWPFQIDPNDDVVCYLFFPERILQTGSLLEPFNVRRMGTFGGQSLLQALVMIVGGERNGHIPDRGFGMLLLFGMLLRLTREMPARAALFRFLLIGCLFFVPVPRINTGSSLTGAATILALIMTLSRVSPASGKSWQLLVAPGLLIAAAGSLRPTYLLFCSGLAAIYFLLPAFRDLILKRPLQTHARVLLNPVALIAGVALVALLPWMIVLWKSNGTPMYPPFAGTLNPEFGVLGSKQGVLQDIAHATAYFFIPETLALLFCFALLWFVDERLLAIAAVSVAVAVSWFTSYKFGVTVLFESYRYTFPMLFPVALWLLALSVRTHVASLEISYRRYPALLALGLLLAINLRNGGAELIRMAETLPQQAGSLQRLVNPLITSAVSDLQKKTEPGAAIFVAIDTPYALDFRRNTIYTADVAGASAIGRWPVGQGPDALKAYLISLGIRYLMVSDFDNAMLLYTRRHWKEHARPEWFFKEVWGKYMLDFMDSADALVLQERLVGTAANIRLIELINPE